MECRGSTNGRIIVRVPVQPCKSKTPNLVLIMLTSLFIQSIPPNPGKMLCVDNSIVFQKKKPGSDLEPG